jgi:trk system potassium uptake protein
LAHARALLHIQVSEATLPARSGRAAHTQRRGLLPLHSAAVRAAIHVSAVFAIYMSAAMLIPAAVDLYYDNRDWQVFAFSAFLMGGFALAVALATHGRAPPVSPRFGFLLVNLLWFTMSLAGAVPFYASSVELSLADAIFEGVSAVTTTGGTVIVGLDQLPPGLQLWRSLLQWMGGLGVIALGLFLLPYLNIGGVSYIKIGTTDIEDRPFERLSTFTIGMFGVYVALTVICAISYAAAGMTGFDALNHAFTTISTGGFSTHDASMGFYADRPAVLWIGTIFMFIGALPFSVLIILSLRGRFDALRDPQIRVFASYTIVIALAVSVYLRVSDGMSFFDALTHGTFNMVSLVTTTGYASDDYGSWGPFAVACAFVATFLGGCSGSTSGGIKAYRFLILFELMANGVRRLVYPNTIQPVRYGDRAVDDDMQRAVVLYIASFLVVWVITIVLLSATGLDLLTAIAGSLTSLTNVGPGLGEFIGPAGTFAPLPDSAKLILSLAMLLGRLEILSVLVIFSPTFWAR